MKEHQHCLEVRKCKILTCKEGTNQLLLAKDIRSFGCWQWRQKIAGWLDSASSTSSAALSGCPRLNPHGPNSSSVMEI